MAAEGEVGILSCGRRLKFDCETVEVVRRRSGGEDVSIPRVMPLLLFLVGCGRANELADGEGDGERS